MCRIAVDGGVGDREFAYDAAALCVEHVLVAAGYLHDAVVERELTDEILGAVGVEELTGQALHGDVGDAHVADVVELLLVERGGVALLVHQDERLGERRGVDGGGCRGVALDGDGAGECERSAHGVGCIGRQCDGHRLRLAVGGECLVEHCCEVTARLGCEHDGLADELHQPARVAHLGVVLRAVAQGEVASSDVACEDHYALHVVLDGLFLVAGLLTGGDVGEHTVDGALEGVAHDVPHRVGAGLSVVEALDELSALAAVDDEARLHDELKPLLSGLAVRAHVLVECDVVERGVLQAERLLLQSGVGGLLSALRAVEGAGVCRIAVDGGVGDREFAYDAAALRVEHVLVAAGNAHDAVLERELVDEILRAVGVEELTGQALHGDVGDAHVADGVEALLIERGGIALLAAQLNHRSLEGRGIDADGTGGVALDGEGTGNLQRRGHRVVAHTQRDGDRLGVHVLGQRGVEGRRDVGAAGQRERYRLADNLYQPARVANLGVVLRAVAQGEVASSDVACEDHYALHVVLDGLFLVAGLLTGGDVGEHTVDGALEGVAHDVPHRVGAGLSVVEALDELSALAAVDDEARLHDELKPLLSGLAVRAHVLVECDVVERGVLQAERLLLQSGVGGLLSALRAVEGAGVCRIAVDGGVGDREFAYDAAALRVEHVLVAAGNAHDAVLERELVDEILRAVGVEKLAGKVLHGYVGYADTADGEEALLIERGGIALLAQLNHRSLEGRGVDADGTGGVALDGEGTGNLKRRGHCVVAHTQRDGDRLGLRVLGQRGVEGRRDVGAAGQRERYRLADNLYQPARVANLGVVLRAVAQGEVASSDVACEDHYALHVVLDGLFLVAGLLTGGDVGEHTVDGALEGVAHDVPHRVGAGLSVVEALDELSALAAVDDEARLHDELKPLLSGLAVRAHVLVECDVVERGVLQAERLLLQSGVGGLLSALRAVEGAGVCRIAVDGGVGDREFAYDAAALCVEHVLVAAGYLHDAVVERELTDEILGAVGVEELTGQALHGDVGDADVADVVELLLVKKGFIRRIAHLNERAFKCGSVDGSRGGNIAD